MSASDSEPQRLWLRARVASRPGNQVGGGDLPTVTAVRKGIIIPRMRQAGISASSVTGGGGNHGKSDSENPPPLERRSF